MSVIKLASSQDRRPVHGCGTCRFFKRRHYGPSFDGCEAVGTYAEFARRIECIDGKLWEPIPIKPPLLVRLKRWLIG